MQLSVFQRIAFSDLNTMRLAQQFIRDNGLPEAADQNEMAMKLAQVVRDGGEKVVPAFVQLHPDAALIIANQPKPQKKYADDAVQEKTPAPVQQQQPTAMAQIESHLPLILTVLTIFTIGAITISSKPKN
jgi:hypothetical protein